MFELLMVWGVKLGVEKALQHKEAVVKVLKATIIVFEARRQDFINVGLETDDFVRECQHFLDILPEQLTVPDCTTKHIEKSSATTTTRQVVDGNGPLSDSSHDHDHQENTTITTTDDSSKKETNDDDSKTEQQKHQLKSEVIIKTVVDKVRKAEELALDFLDADNKRSRSSMGYMKWMAYERPIRAKELRKYFITETHAIRKKIDDLCVFYKMQHLSSKVNIDRLREDMTEDGYWFWVTYIGKDNMTGTWDQFIGAYQLLYGAVEPARTKRYLRHILSNRDGDVSIFRLITAVGTHGGFPFSKDIAMENGVINTISEAEDISEEKRMKLTEMTMQLVKDFSSEQMRIHLHNIYGWFNGIDKKDEKQVQVRGDEWGRLVKAIRKKEYGTKQHPSDTTDLQEEDKIEWTEELEKQVDDVDKARRTIYFFYEEFMVMWRVGEVSRDTLQDVDFPGRGRIIDFITLVGALDHANYYIVIGKEKDDPKREYTPELYEFLEEYLEILEQQSAERKKLKETRKQLRTERRKKRKEEEELKKKEQQQKQNENGNGNSNSNGKAAVVAEVSTSTTVNEDPDSFICNEENSPSDVEGAVSTTAISNTPERVGNNNN